MKKQITTIFIIAMIFTILTLIFGTKITYCYTSVNLEDIKPIIKQQIDCNTAIAEEGLTGKWGAKIGKTLLGAYGCDY